MPAASSCSLAVQHTGVFSFYFVIIKHVPNSSLSETRPVTRLVYGTVMFLLFVFINAITQ